MRARWWHRGPASHRCHRRGSICSPSKPKQSKASKPKLQQWQWTSQQSCLANRAHSCSHAHAIAGSRAQLREPIRGRPVIAGGCPPPVLWSQRSFQQRAKRVSECTDGAAREQERLCCKAQWQPARQANSLASTGSTGPPSVCQLPSCRSGRQLDSRPTLDLFSTRSLLISLSLSARSVLRRDLFSHTHTRHTRTLCPFERLALSTRSNFRVSRQQLVSSPAPVSLQRWHFIVSVLALALPLSCSRPLSQPESSLFPVCK